MPSNVKITDQKELEEFVRTHLGHRLTAMVSPICLPENHPRWNSPCRRNDAYRAAKEGSYSMLRLFIEFLGVKEDRQNSGELKEAQGEGDTILLDAFSKWGVRKVEPKDFGKEEGFIAQVHRTLCKINAHFTYDSSKAKSYDRIDSPDDDLGNTGDLCADGSSNFKPQPGHLNPAPLNNKRKHSLRKITL
jgi:hypothetical protein